MFFKANGYDTNDKSFFDKYFKNMGSTAGTKTYYTTTGNQGNYYRYTSSSGNTGNSATYEKYADILKGKNGYSSTSTSYKTEEPTKQESTEK